MTWSSLLLAPKSCKTCLMPAKPGASAAACKSTLIRQKSWSFTRLYAVHAHQLRSLSPRDSRPHAPPPRRTSKNPTHSYAVTWASSWTQFSAWTQQACVLPFTTQNLRYFRTPTQLQTIQTALTNSLQRILRSYTIAEILLLEFGVPPLRLQQACQLISLHYRYLSTHHPTLQVHNQPHTAHSSTSLPHPPPVPTLQQTPSPVYRNKNSRCTHPL